MISKWVFPLIHAIWRLWDVIVPKRADYWAFTTHHIRTTVFNENPRAVFEVVRLDPAIRKIVFYRGDATEFQIEGGVNCVVVKYGTLRSLLLLARCKVLLFPNSIAMDFSLRWGNGAFAIVKPWLGNRVVVNLWHGIAIKRLFDAANQHVQKRSERSQFRRKERRSYSGLVASSDLDALVMAAMFHPLNLAQVWTTGLPRNDFLVAADSELPDYIRQSVALIREACGGRRLVLYAPTYRQTAVSDAAFYYQFSNQEVGELTRILKRHNAVLGFRPHYFKNSNAVFNLGEFIDGVTIVDMSNRVIPEFAAVARECCAVVTDYSSVHLEALYLGKPSISFAYDLDCYQADQDGLLYDLRDVFAGPICHCFADVLQQLDRCLAGESIVCCKAEERIRRTFFKFRDGRNSERVVQQIKEALKLR